ncbi:MAG: hypothetical protein KDD14_10865 [Saprospiraceae bacterium]|nr:hypothetical protein [Saprospiraceae bacterium]
MAKTRIFAELIPVWVVQAVRSLKYCIGKPFCAKKYPPGGVPRRVAKITGNTGSLKVNDLDDNRFRAPVVTRYCGYASLGKSIIHEQAGLG